MKDERRLEVKGEEAVKVIEHLEWRCIGAIVSHHLIIEKACFHSSAHLHYGFLHVFILHSSPFLSWETVASTLLHLHAVTHIQKHASSRKHLSLFINHWSTIYNIYSSQGNQRMKQRSEGIVFFCIYTHIYTQCKLVLVLHGTFILLIGYRDRQAGLVVKQLQH